MLFSHVALLAFKTKIWRQHAMTDTPKKLIYKKLYDTNGENKYELAKLHIYSQFENSADLSVSKVHRCCKRLFNPLITKII